MTDNVYPLVIITEDVPGGSKVWWYITQAGKHVTHAERLFDTHEDALADAQTHRDALNLTRRSA